MLSEIVLNFNIIHLTTGFYLFLLKFESFKSQIFAGKLHGIV